tara:strand:- start:168 stop:317 length:150 start_codon:yes stop_codon:yes gene_type:complete
MREVKKTSLIHFPHALIGPVLIAIQQRNGSKNEAKMKQGAIEKFRKIVL